MNAEHYLFRRFSLPSGKLVEVRRIHDGDKPEVAVREVNDDDELAPGEFNLTLSFLLTRTRMLRR